MRFCKETRALIYDAEPHPVTIPWPPGAPEPQKGRVYWLQSEEDAKEAERKAKTRREYSPETCAEVLVGMHLSWYGTEPEAKPKKRRRRSIRRPRSGDPRIFVIDVAILDKGWEAKVALYEDPDPVRHLGVKAKVPAGPNPIDGFQEKTQLESEPILVLPSRRRREEEEDALQIEHKASVDHAEIIKAEQRLLDQRRRGKTGTLAEAAVAKAKRRAELDPEAA